MAIYVQPTFNVQVAFWRFGNVTSNPPDVVAFANLSPGRIVSGDKGDDTIGAPAGQTMWLRLPKATDVQDQKNGIGPDTCECPFTSGRFYDVVIVDDVGGGFPNEHRFAVIGGKAVWPVPFPPVGGFTPIVPPAPPTVLGTFSTLGVAVNTMNFPINSVTTRCYGFLTVFNQAAVPVLTVGGAPGIYGGALVNPIGPFPVGVGNGLLYGFSCWPCAAVGGLTVTFPGLFAGAFHGWVCDWSAPGGVNRNHSFNQAALVPPFIPIYPPVPVAPTLHLAAFEEVLPGANAFLPPYVAFGPAVLDVIGGVASQLSVGKYLALVNGAYPAAKGLPAPANFAGIEDTWRP